MLQKNIDVKALKNWCLRFHVPLFAASMVCLTGQVGCDRDPMVRVYDVPKVPVVASNFESVPKRFVIAIIPDGDRAFFIKASDQPERLESFLESLRQIAADFKIGEDKKPVWKLPEGWQANPGTGIASAILEVSADGAPVQFTVTELPMPTSKEDLDSYLESNINRWRGQLGLPPNSIAEQRPKITEVPRGEGTWPAYLIDLQGISSTRLLPMRKGIETAKSESPKKANLTVESPLKYVSPVGWMDEGTTSMRAASFSLDGDKSKGEVTVVFASGDRLSNVERWQGQLNPSGEAEFIRISAAKVVENAITIKSASGIEGQLYSLLGPEGESQPAMLAAIFPMDPRSTDERKSSVFVKLTASAKIAVENRDKLIAFIESLKW